MTSINKETFERYTSMSLSCAVVIVCIAVSWVLAFWDDIPVNPAHKEHFTQHSNAPLKVASWVWLSGTKQKPHTQLINKICKNMVVIFFKTQQIDQPDDNNCCMSLELSISTTVLGWRLTITGTQIKSFSHRCVPPMQHNYCQHFYGDDTAKEHDIPWLRISCSSLSSVLSSFIGLPARMCFMFKRHSVCCGLWHSLQKS